MVKIVLLCVLLIVFIIIGSKVELFDIKRSQMKILKDKGFNFNNGIILKGIANFDLYFDKDKKKILLFHKTFRIFDVKSLNSFEYNTEVIDGRYYYFLSFKLNDEKYEISLKGNIKAIDKVMYEEAIRFISSIVEFNNLLENKNMDVKKSTKKKTTKKSTKKKSDNSKMSVKKDSKKSATSRKTTSKKDSVKKDK